MPPPPLLRVHLGRVSQLCSPSSSYYFMQLTLNSSRKRTPACSSPEAFCSTLSFSGDKRESASPGDVIKVQLFGVKHHRLYLGPRELGSCDVRVVREESNEFSWYALRNAKGEEVGKVLIRMELEEGEEEQKDAVRPRETVSSAADGAVPRSEDKREAVFRACWNGVGRYENGVYPRWTLRVRVIRARQLRIADSLVGSSDPFCHVGVRNVMYKTDICMRTLNPVFEEGSFEFGTGLDVLNESDVVEVTVFDWDRLKKSDFLGLLRVPIWAFVKPNNGNEGWFALSSMESAGYQTAYSQLDSMSHGEIFIKLEVVAMGGFQPLQFSPSYMGLWPGYPDTFERIKEEALFAMPDLPPRPEIYRRYKGKVWMHRLDMSILEFRTAEMHRHGGGGEDDFHNPISRIESFEEHQPHSKTPPDLFSPANHRSGASRLGVLKSALVKTAGGLIRSPPKAANATAAVAVSALNTLQNVPAVVLTTSSSKRSYVYCEIRCGGLPSAKPVHTRYRREDGARPSWKDEIFTFGGGDVGLRVEDGSLGVAVFRREAGVETCVGVGIVDLQYVADTMGYIDFEGMELKCWIDVITPPSVFPSRVVGALELRLMLKPIKQTRVSKTPMLAFHLENIKGLANSAMNKNRFEVFVRATLLNDDEGFAQSVQESGCVLTDTYGQADFNHLFVIQHTSPRFCVFLQVFDYKHGREIAKAKLRSEGKINGEFLEWQMASSIVPETSTAVADLLMPPLPTSNIISSGSMIKKEIREANYSPVLGVVSLTLTAIRLATHNFKHDVRVIVKYKSNILCTSVHRRDVDFSFGLDAKFRFNVTNLYDELLFDVRDVYGVSDKTANETLECGKLVGSYNLTLFDVIEAQNSQIVGDVGLALPLMTTNVSGVGTQAHGKNHRHRTSSLMASEPGTLDVSIRYEEFMFSGILAMDANPPATPIPPFGLERSSNELNRFSRVAMWPWHFANFCNDMLSWSNVPATSGLFVIMVMFSVNSFFAERPLMLFPGGVLFYMIVQHRRRTDGQFISGFIVQHSASSMDDSHASLKVCCVRADLKPKPDFNSDPRPVFIANIVTLENNHERFIGSSLFLDRATRTPDWSAQIGFRKGPFTTLVAWRDAADFRHQEFDRLERVDFKKACTGSELSFYVSIEKAAFSLNPNQAFLTAVDHPRTNESGVNRSILAVRIIRGSSNDITSVRGGGTGDGRGFWSSAGNMMGHGSDRLSNKRALHDEIVDVSHAPPHKSYRVVLQPHSADGSFVDSGRSRAKSTKPCGIGMIFNEIVICELEHDESLWVTLVDDRTNDLLGRAEIVNPLHRKQGIPVRLPLFVNTNKLDGPSTIEMGSLDVVLDRFGRAATITPHVVNAVPEQDDVDEDLERETNFDVDENGDVAESFILRHQPAVDVAGVVNMELRKPRGSISSLFLAGVDQLDLATSTREIDRGRLQAVGIGGGNSSGGNGGSGGNSGSGGYSGSGGNSGSGGVGMPIRRLSSFYNDDVILNASNEQHHASSALSSTFVQKKTRVTIPKKSTLEMSRVSVKQWQKSTDVLIVDVYDRTVKSNNFLGRAMLPLKNIMPDVDALEQPIYHEWLPLMSRADGSPEDRLLYSHNFGRIMVSAQITLPKPVDPERAREALEARRAKYLPHERLAALRRQADKTYRALRVFNDNMEKMKNTFNWAVLSRTRLVFRIMVIFFALCLLIPSRFLVLFVGLWLFTEKFRPHGVLAIVIGHLIALAPTDEDLLQVVKREVFGRRIRGEFDDTRVTGDNDEIANPDDHEEDDTLLNEAFTRADFTLKRAVHTAKRAVKGVGLRTGAIRNANSFEYESAAMTGDGAPGGVASSPGAVRNFSSPGQTEQSVLIFGYLRVLERHVRGLWFRRYFFTFDGAAIRYWAKKKDFVLRSPCIGTLSMINGVRCVEHNSDEARVAKENDAWKLETLFVVEQEHFSALAGVGSTFGSILRQDALGQGKTMFAASSQESRDAWMYALIHKQTRYGGLAAVNSADSVATISTTTVVGSSGGNDQIEVL